jgi:hypothetical protein
MMRLIQPEAARMPGVQLRIRLDVMVSWVIQTVQRWLAEVEHHFATTERDSDKRKRINTALPRAALYASQPTPLGSAGAAPRARQRPRTQIKVTSAQCEMCCAVC